MGSRCLLFGWVYSSQTCILSSIHSMSYASQVWYVMPHLQVSSQSIMFTSMYPLCLVRVEITTLVIHKFVHRFIHGYTKKARAGPQPRVVQRFLNLLRWRKGNRNENLDASRRGWRTHRKKGKEKPPTMKGSLRVFLVVFPIAEEQKTQSLVYHY